MSDIPRIVVRLAEGIPFNHVTIVRLHTVRSFSFVFQEEVNRSLNYLLYDALSDVIGKDDPLYMTSKGGFEPR